MEDMGEDGGGCENGTRGSSLSLFLLLSISASTNSNFGGGARERAWPSAYNVTSARAI